MKGFAAAAERWVTECSKCGAMFRDGPEIDGICPHCGHDNDVSD